MELTPEQKAALPDRESPREAADREALERVRNCLALTQQIRLMRDRAARGERVEDPS